MKNHVIFQWSLLGVSIHLEFILIH